MWKVVCTTREGDDVREFTSEQEARRFYEDAVRQEVNQRVTIADPDDIVVDCDPL